MLPEKRQTEILDYIREKQDNCAEVEELSRKFNASKSTIRRDLKKLEEKDILQRIHGGAMIKNGTADEIKAKHKRLINVKEKRHIAEIASSFIKNSDSIILDSGSTTFEVAKHLNKYNRLTVVTYDLRIAIDIGLGVESKMILTGGERRNGFEVLIGSRCEKFLKEIYVDKAFLGADAIDLEHGVTNSFYPEVPIKKEVLNSAKEVFLVADNTKFDKRVLAQVCDLKEIDTIVTDPGIDKKIAKELEDKNLKIVY